MQLRYSDIPLWLQSSALYHNLSDDEPGDGMIDIPAECYRSTDDNVTTWRDLADILTVMRFWGVSSIPNSVLEFCYSHDSALWMHPLSEVVEETCSDYLSLVKAFQFPKQFSLEAALMTARPEIVLFWFEKAERRNKQGKNAVAQACRYGRLDLVETLRKRGFSWDSWAYCAAAQYGHLELLHYLHDKDCPLDSTALIFAMRGGQVECMKYLRSIGCPWNKEMLNEYAVPAHYAYLKEHPLDEAVWTDDFSIEPPAKGYIDCLQYGLQNDCHATCEACNKACEYGLLDCLYLFEEYRIIFDVSAFSIAASFGHVNCLNFLIEIGCYGNDDVCADAARHGHLPCLKFLREHRFAWNQNTVNCAAEYGHLECLQYAIEHGCAFNAQVALEYATKSQNTACIEYLLKNIASSSSDDD